MEAGGDPARFWNITPVEVAREMQALFKRQEYEMERTSWLAWHIEALARTKKLPPLKDMLARPDREERRPSQEELIMKLKMAFGYPGNIAE